MTVRSKPEVFAAGDGREFPTKEEAELHDELVEAIGDYRNSQERLTRAMAATIKTADGELFDVRRWSDYWFVSPGGFACPTIVAVAVGYGTKLELPGDYSVARAEVVITHQDRRGCVERTHYRVDELYADERKAKRALVAMIEKVIIYLPHQGN